MIKIILLVLVSNTVHKSLVAMEEVIPAHLNTQQAQVSKSYTSPFKRIHKVWCTRSLMRAVKLQDVARVGICIKKGADVNFQDSNGNTPLHFVSESMNLELMKLFLQTQGVNPTIVNKLGLSPVDIACVTQEHTESLTQDNFDIFLKYMFSLESDTYRFNQEERTVLECAQERIRIKEVSKHPVYQWGQGPLSKVK